MLICHGQNFAGRTGAVCFCDDQGMRPRHKNSGRYTFICDIPDEYAQLTITQFKHIVKIAANLTRRKDTPTKVVVWVRWQNVWEDRHLNIGSHLEFPFEALFFDQ